MKDPNEDTMAERPTRRALCALDPKKLISNPKTAAEISYELAMKPALVLLMSKRLSIEVILILFTPFTTKPET